MRLALAGAIGLFIGIERERRRKEAGLRTFAFAAILGCVGGLLGNPFALLALGLLGILVILLNVETIHTGEGAEITTSAALFVTGFAGVLAGQGHTFTPTVLGIATAALLAWKEPLAGFSVALTESEFRSAVLLAIVAFVVYPLLPMGSIDPWQLVEPREAWVTVVLIAALGFANYVLLKLYGARGIELTGFLGGLVNSTATVAELASRVKESAGELADAGFKAVALATGAMLVRNGIILGIFAPAAFIDGALPVALMMAGVAIAWRLTTHPVSDSGDASRGRQEAPVRTLTSPFSLTAALKFGLVFLVLQVAGTLAQRFLGTAGFYAVSVAGGVVSSASAVASAATLSAGGVISPYVASVGAVAASIASALIDWPIVARVSRDQTLTRSVGRLLWAVAVLGVLGLVIQGVVRGL
jgi:uncharacterized membrane protein (DUF4010 family)